MKNKILEIIIMALIYLIFVAIISFITVKTMLILQASETDMSASVNLTNKNAYTTCCQEQCGYLR